MAVLTLKKVTLPFFTPHFLCPLSLPARPVGQRLMLITSRLRITVLDSDLVRSAVLFLFIRLSVS